MPIQPDPAIRPARRKPLSFEDVQIGDLRQNHTSDPFGRSSIPASHPLVQAFDLSYSEGAAIDVPTPDTEGVRALLRKIAKARGLGVQMAVSDSLVTFQARARRTRAAAAPEAETAESFDGDWAQSYADDGD